MEYLAELLTKFILRKDVIDESEYKYIIVRTMGNRNTSTYYNETKGGTANIQKGVPSSVTNYCYERRTSGAATVKVRLQLKSGSALTGTVKGVWSPDSTKSYTVVN